MYAPYMNERSFIYIVIQDSKKRSSMDTKVTKGQQTREKLLEAALVQFTATGYHGASMRQIAETAGVAVGGIYNHFSSKEEILKAVILAYHPLNFILPALAKTEGETLEAFLRNAAEQLLNALAEQPTLLNIFMIELLEFEGAHLPELFEVLWPKVQIFAQRLTTLDTRLRPLPPLTIVRLFLGSLVGFYITGRILSKLPMPQSQQIGTIDDLVTVLTHGLLTQTTG